MLEEPNFVVCLKLDVADDIFRACLDRMKEEREGESEREKGREGKRERERESISSVYCDRARERERIASSGY